MKPLYTNRGKQNKLLKLAVCILLVASLLIMGGCSDTNAVKQQVQQGMTAYLNDRYGMEFDVDMPYISGEGYAAQYHAKAHPKGQPQVEFVVDDSRSVNNPDLPPPNPRNTDNYLEAKWSYQAKQEIEKKLREVYGPNVDFNIRGYEFHGGNYSLKDLDFDQVFEKDHGHGGIYLDYDVFMDGAQFNKAAEAKKAYQIMKPFVLDFRSDSCRLSVTYIDKAFKLDYLADSKPYVANWLVQHGRQHYSPQYEEEIKDKKLLGYLGWNYMLNPTYINSDSDLVKYFE